MKNLPCAALAALLLLPAYGAGDAGRADDHAPIGVMADHRHHEGEWMFSYRDLTPMGESVLPYPMQIGSGSWSATGSLTWNRQRDRDSIGAQIRGLVRLNDNKHDYRREDRVEATAWGAWAPRPELSVSLRAKYSAWSDVRDADSRFAGALAGSLVPTVDPQLRGGERLESIAGLNLLLGGHRLGVELSLPLHRNLDGPQLETDRILSFGWQYAMK